MGALEADTAPPDPLVGQIVGNYRILEPLGSGGMGTVYLAEHPTIGKRLALKVLHPGMAQHPEHVARFVGEARAVARIGHRNIVDVVDFGTLPDGRSYFSMELLRGRTLEQELQRVGRLPARRAAQIAAQVCRALSATHRQGIVHRDLKCDNVFLCEEVDGELLVKVLDFGVAKLAVDPRGSRITRAGEVFGTPAYMAPEQARGMEGVDHRADLYAVGVMLYQMVTGRLPFDAPNATEVLVQHLLSRPRPPHEIAPEVPAECEAIVLRCLEKDPGRRHQSAAELHDDLSLLAGIEGSGQSLLPRPGRRAAASAVETLPPAAGDAGAAARPSTAEPLVEVPARPPEHARVGQGRGSAVLLVGIAAAAVTTVAVSLILVLAGGEAGTPSGSGPARPALFPASAPGRAGPNGGVPEGPAAPASEAGAPASAAAPRSAAPAASAPTVLLEIVSAPPGARVYLDAEARPRGVTPARIPLPADGRSVRIVLRKPGFHAATRVVVADRDRHLDAALEPSRRAGSPRGPGAKGPAGDRVLRPRF